MDEQEEAAKVAAAMTVYGGSFVAALGSALIHADIDNIRRIKKAFPEYWKQYVKMGGAVNG